MFAFVIDDKITKPKRGKSGIDHNNFCGILKEKHNILLFPSFQNDAIRVVTHRDVSREDMEVVRDTIRTELRQFL